jgi:hypothetical protein
VIYVFGQKPIDIYHCVQQFVSILNMSSAEHETEKRAILLRHDVAYTHLAGEDYSYLHHYEFISDSA